jgi:hypothetical protein
MIGLFLASLILSIMLTGASLLPDEHSLEAHSDARTVGPQLPAISGPLWSLRFWILCALGFGLAGTPLSLLEVGPVVALCGALLSGASLGSVLWPVFEEPSTDVTLSDLAGTEGRVLRVVRPTGGRIVIETLASRLELPARSGDGSVIGVGRRVFVAFIDNGVACVVSYG